MLSTFLTGIALFLIGAIKARLVSHKWHRGESHDANAYGALLHHPARLVAKHNVGRMTANTELFGRIQANADGHPGAPCKLAG